MQLNGTHSIRLHTWFGIILSDTFSPDCTPSLLVMSKNIFFKISICWPFLQNFLEMPSVCGLGLEFKLWDKLKVSNNRLKRETNRIALLWLLKDFCFVYYANKFPLSLSSNGLDDISFHAVYRLHKPSQCSIYSFA